MMKHLTGDAVFLDVSSVQPLHNERFSLFKHVKPNLIEATRKALDISSSVAFRLPKETDFEELSVLFHKTFEKYDIHTEKYSIEIEKIYIDGEFDSIAVYFGNCNQV